MQIPPPEFSKREREILPHLATSATRQEIADHFGLSPDTIKQHNARILKKLHSKSMLGAHRIISKYVEYYGGDAPLFQVYCENAHVHVIVNLDKKRVYITRNQTFRVIIGDVHELLLVLPESTYPIHSVRINHIPVTPIATELGRKVYKSNFHTPFGVGQRFHRQIDIIRKIVTDPMLNGEYSAWKTFPAQKLTFELMFQGPLVPTKLHHIIRLNSMPVHDASVQSKQLQNGLRLIIDKPDIAKAYSIRWSW